MEITDFKNRSINLNRPPSLQEMMDQALKNITGTVGAGGKGTYKFTMEGDTPGFNEYHQDITYTIKFSKASPTSVTVQDPTLFGEPIYLTYKSSCLTFSNNVSGMQELGGEEGYMRRNLGYPANVAFSASLVYGSVGRILLDHFKSTSPQAIQGLDFSTAGPQLVRPYIILCKEAQRKGDLLWLNKTDFHGQEHENFNLIRRSRVDMIKEILQQQHFNSHVND